MAELRIAEDPTRYAHVVKLQASFGSGCTPPKLYTTRLLGSHAMPSQYTAVQIARFWSHVDRSGECWLWLLQRTSEGYGRVRVNGERWFAHRFSYTIAKGPIPPELTIDHLCRTRACVRPDHLEAVTVSVNVLRGQTPQALNLAKTHCQRGHPFDDANTRLTGNGRHRVCRACRRQSTQRRYEAGQHQGPATTRVTHCPRGHEYTPENTRLSKMGGRNCRVCDRLRARRAATS